MCTQCTPMPLCPDPWGTVANFAHTYTCTCTCTCTYTCNMQHARAHAHTYTRTHTHLQQKIHIYIWQCDSGGRTQVGSLPRTRKGRPAEAGRARDRSGRPLEWRRTAVRQRSDPFARLPRAPHSPASSGSRLGEKVVERAVGRCASGRRHHCPWPGALHPGRLGLPSRLPMRPWDHASAPEKRSVKKKIDGAPVARTEVLFGKR